jgi:hypothetical protein
MGRTIPRPGDVKDVFPALRDELRRDYGNAVPQDAIDWVARHAIERLNGARVREFVPLLAERHARAHLRGMGSR